MIASWKAIWLAPDGPRKRLEATWEGLASPAYRDSPAGRAGIRAEDLILEVNGTPISRVEDLQKLMVADLIGSAVTVRLLRQGRERRVELVPAELE